MSEPIKKGMNLANRNSVGDLYPDTMIVKKHTIPAKLSGLIPSSLVRQYRLIPLSLEGGKLIVGIQNPHNFIALEHIERYTGLRIIPRAMDLDSINHHIDRLYGSEPIEKALYDFNRELSINESNDDWIVSSGDTIADGPIVRIVDSILAQAVEKGASDIHIEPTSDGVRIRFRIDGVLQTITSLPLSTHHSILTRVKVLGNMDIAEKRLPQDGRTEIIVGKKSVDIRISTIPTIYGEKCLLRLLDREFFLFPKTALGFTKENLDRFNRLLLFNRGLIIICGPTGSGKSTTMYTMLSEMNRETHNIITIEDPVECKISGTNQIQINEKGGITFANSLRSVLRQDPDIIMVGEIRDKATAEMAIEAAITGHLVISTLHTHDAIGAVVRLLEIGIENYFLADALGGVVSQRLARKVCKECCEMYNPNPEEQNCLGLDYNKGRVWSKAIGCIKCDYTGYRGRTAIHEVLIIDKQIKELISKGASSEQIYDYASRQGFNTIKDHFIEILDCGLTTMEEALRIGID